MKNPPIYIIDKSSDDGLKDVLEYHLCPYFDRNSETWQQTILYSSPSLGPYLIQGMALALPKEGDDIRLYINTSQTATRPKLGSQWDFLLKNISVPLSIVCAAGGAKVLIDILRIWVEERNSRCITFKYKDIEITLKGSTNDKDVERIIRLLEERFISSKIIIPE